MPSIMESLLENSAINNLSAQSIAEGLVTEILENEVVVDIGGKSEGVIPAREFPDLSELSVGDTIEVFVERIESKDGSIAISFEKARQKRNWERIIAEHVEGSVVTGQVRAKVKGGLVVDVGVDAFLPASQLDVHAAKSLDEHVGQSYEFKVLKINRERRNLVLSRRELLEEQRRMRRRELLDRVKTNDIIEGVVKNITDYGAFLDLDGLDGLLHITDMRWGRVGHPSEVLKVGETLRVMVLDVDRDRERVSLGLKQTMDNPWDTIERNYPVGAHVKGTVVNLVPYGAFIKLQEGVEGLVHITEFSWTRRINKPAEVLKVGDEVEAVVMGIQKESHRISLSLRQIEPNPWDAIPRNYPAGARVQGTVHRFTNYGAFVQLEEGIDGLIHVSDMSWTQRVNHPSEMLKEGQEIEAIVLAVDAENHRISLGFKQLSKNPWEDIESLFKIGDKVKAKVAKLAKYGAFVQLENQIDGLVHISQISEERVEKVGEHLKVGDTIEARVIKIDVENRHIGLSIKAVEYDNQRLASEVSAFEAAKPGDQLGNIGDILEEATAASEVRAEPKP